MSVMDAVYTMNNTGIVSIALVNQTKQNLLYFCLFQCEVIDSLQCCAFQNRFPSSDYILTE